ncbi:hypothetical protein [Microcoleus sp. D2_18a_D3]
MLLDLVGDNFFDFIQPSTANSQQPTANSQQPTANSQQSIELTVD